MSFTVLDTSLAALRATALRVPAHRLDDPTPCSRWNVAQVLLHAAGDQHGWAATVGAGTLPAYDPFDPPAQLTGSIAELIQPAVDSAANVWARIEPGSGPVRTPLPPFPTMTPELAAGACALDAPIHAWDVAVATGQDSPLTDDLAEQLEPAARAVADALRGFAYAPPVPGQASDDASSALLRYLGRDPRWTA